MGLVLLGPAMWPIHRRPISSRPTTRGSDSGVAPPPNAASPSSDTQKNSPTLSPSAQPPAPPRMASGSDAEQQQKRAAAAAYDYEGDARWAEYWSNVLVPAHLASRPDVIDHFKRKFYQRFIVSTTTDYQAAEPALPPKLVRSHLPVLMLLDFDSSP
jgi:hypothetical protein